MAEFRMPSLGADMESAVLTEWLVKPNDPVKRGQVVATVETAKGIIDIEIFEDGAIETLLASPGQVVPVGGVLASYRPAGAPAAAAVEGERRAPATAGAAQLGGAETIAEPMPAAPAKPRAQAQAAVARPEGGPPAERRLVSPAARKRAEELGVDLAGVTPARPGVAITLGDVERAAATRAPAPMPDMRSVIASAMSRSKREIPHYYVGTTIDMTRALRFVETWNASHGVTERLLYGVLLLKAVARALESYPELNGFWRDDRFEPSAAINVGTATRLRRGGLVAPALEATNRQALPELMRRFQDVVQRARAGRLRQVELAGATITVSSLGEDGAEVLFPIIHPPQVAIVGFGSIVERPWCVEGNVVAARLLTATLSADHRASDGHRGSQFLVAVDRLLQRPEEL
jgi:pyruvate dehydrogenase E2 component (dihydrolipoamide acetyltransferase)